MDEKLGKKMTTKITQRVSRGTVKASKKKNSTWLWLIKIFYTIKKKRFKASEKHANCLKTVYGKFRQFASVIQMFAKENREASPHEIAHSIL